MIVEKLVSSFIGEGGMHQLSVAKLNKTAEKGGTKESNSYWRVEPCLVIKQRWNCRLSAALLKRGSKGNRSFKEKMRQGGNKSREIT